MALEQSHRRFDDAAPFKIDGVYCKLIPLKGEQFAVVDASDYESLIRLRWRARRGSRSRHFYALRYKYRHGSSRKVRRYRLIQMHREILGLTGDDPAKQVDHKNGCTLDNRRNNLRVATSLQNQHNQGVRTNNTSGFKGVSFCNADRRWHSFIRIGNGRRLNLGGFATPEEAHAAYCAAAYKYHGEFARVA